MNQPLRVRHGWVGLWISLLSLIGLSGCVTQPVAHTPIQPIQPVQPAGLSVEVWTDRSVPEYAIGEVMQLYLRTNQTAQVVVLNIDAHNRTTVLLPNNHTTHNRLVGGQVYPFPAAGAPFRLRVAPPAGANRIRVIATSGDQAILQPQAMSYSTSGPFATYTQSPDALMRQVQVVGQQSGGQWAVQDYVFQVR